MISILNLKGGALYVLRPIFACREIPEKGTPPPMLFSHLVDSKFDPRLRSGLNRLLELKMNSPGIREIPCVDPENDYLDHSIIEIEARIAQLPD